jgi:hypothetical protein
MVGAFCILGGWGCVLVRYFCKLKGWSLGPRTFCLGVGGSFRSGPVKEYMTMVELVQAVVNVIFALQSAFGVLDFPGIGSILITLVNLLCGVDGVSC